MVQYVINPWRSPDELLHLRSHLYAISEEGNSSSQAADSAPKRRKCQNQMYEKIDGNFDIKHEKDENIEISRVREIAVARVRIWMQRGNCPHLVESTAILTSAILNDKKGNEIYCVRAVYSAAFCRFVTGLLDCHQEKRHKLSMYALAKTIHLPASFVDIRHQATHEELPSLSRLRIATHKALEWIWSYYWVNLPMTGTSKGICDAEATLESKLRILASKIKDNDSNDASTEIVQLLKQWPRDQILNQLFHIQSLENNVMILLSVAKILSKVLRADSRASPAPRKIEELWTELELYKHDFSASNPSVEGKKEKKKHMEVDHSKGWALWEGPWIPKPIGMV